MTAVAVASATSQARARAVVKTNETVRIAQHRLMVLLMLFALMTAIIGARLMWLAVVDAPDRGPAAAPAGLRADITDRNGVVLASTIKGWSIGIFPKKIITDRNKLAADLARILPAKTEAEYRKIVFSNKGFVYLEQNSVPATVEAVNALGEPAIQLEREPERFYPQGTMASQVIGYIEPGGEKLSGMEAYLSKQLTDPARHGAPVALSIDSRVQAAMESALGLQMAKHSAVGAAGIVLDVKTGEILAMTSLPNFNPNAPGQAPVSADNTQPDARYNRSVSSVFELGSIFKMITVANAIEHGVINNMGQRYDATAPLHVGGFPIHDDHPQNRWLTVPEILIYSSNIGTARIADELGQARTASFFRQLGFDRPVNLELGARAHPLWPGFWARTTVMTVAYGHGIAVSQLHLANAYAALVNGGILHQATLIKRPPGEVPGTRIVSEATSARMRQLMRLVVTMGTGKKASAPGLRVGGKTGTAEKNIHGHYIGNSLVTTFAAVFPMDAPRYVVIATLDEPKGIPETFGLRTAAWTVAPAVRSVISRIGPLLGIIPEEGRDVDVSDLMPYVQQPDDKPGHVAE
ncbi:cell division protein FtsI (penicillin-binding protein 3) [Sphingomonas sp. YR710]|jgi:cell division protein FtsI (penicillin-binding protein 3)|uniref:peptidoglycan D,D-transpeptidase FtsI family protein n=1 Tax=Sphingomonas sp. YR710 TaxID=1882773 RepID=UPI0008905F9E|nr:penicillin-binding protein 2 [Sphingomonas sp. YR710]SDC71888.1 cell division protein FtsI (penicillin-binding protein 3) [Sphingomonas sp. YR710]